MFNIFCINKNLQYCICLGKIISACVFIHLPVYEFVDFSIMFNYIGMVNLFKFITISVIFTCHINNCVSKIFIFTCPHRYLLVYFFNYLIYILLKILLYKFLQFYFKFSLFISFLLKEKILMFEISKYFFFSEQDFFIHYTDLIFYHSWLIRWGWTPSFSIVFLEFIILFSTKD